MTDRITVGNVEILAFVDIGPAPRDPAMVFPDVPAASWDAYKDTMTPDGLLPFQMGFFAVRSGGQTMLVDTGLGQGPFEAMGGIGGQLMDQLSGAGINPDEISRVLITHLHGDHVGWNVTWDGDAARATFPNATYSVPQGDWDYFTSADVLPNSRRTWRTASSPCRASTRWSLSATTRPSRTRSPRSSPPVIRRATSVS